MKKILLLLLAALIILSLFGCSAPNYEDGKIDIVCTVFPIYDWAREILGSEENLILLNESGTDMHSFQPSAKDLIEIATSDIIIYLGGESDAWIEKALRQSENPNQSVICLLDILDDKVKEEEITLGMQHEEKHHGQEDHHEAEPDEHIWLSIKNAMICVEAMANTFCEQNPRNSAFYSDNLCRYKERLAKLDAKYEEELKSRENKTIVFADRFPFRYLFDDYSLNHYAAFPGCSAETEASFETIIFLAARIDEFSLPCIAVTDTGDTKIASTVKANTKEKNQSFVTLHSMQSISKRDIKNSVNYIGIMEENLAVLLTALDE